MKIKRHRRGAPELAARPKDRRRIAPAEDPHRAAMRIAPRTMLCANVFRVHEHVAGARFDELRQLCTAAGDKASLAIAMVGLVVDHSQGGTREASQLASEAMAPIESIGDPTLTVGLSFALLYAKAESGEWSDALRWSQRVIDLAGGDPSKGNFVVWSPLAFAFMARGNARCCLGRPGWRDDLHRAVAMARRADPVSYAAIVAYVYNPGIPFGALRLTIPQCARSKMPYGLANDPVMTLRWPSPG